MRLLIATLIVALGCYQSGPFVAAQPAYINHVPADCFMVAHEEVSDDAQFVRDYWGGFFDSVKATNFWEPLVAEFQKQVPAEQRAEAEQRFEEIQALLLEIDWAALTAKEVLFTQRMNLLAENGLEFYEGAFLFRVGPEKVTDLQGQLSSLLEYAASFHPAMSVEKSSLGGVESAKLHIFGVAQMIVSGYKDTIVAAANPGLHEQLLKSLAGVDTGAKLIDTDRFKEVIAELPTNGYNTFYMDFDSMLDSIHAGILRGIEQDNPAELAEAKPVLEFIRNNLSMLDRIGAETYVQGARVFNQSVLVSGDGWEETILGAAIVSQQPFDSPTSFLPVETLSFSLNTFLNPATFYSEVKGQISAQFPEAAEGFAMIETEVRNGIALDLESDILAPWSGESVMVNLPGIAGRPMPVSMMKLDDEDKALTLVTMATEAISQIAKEAGQPISIMAASGPLADTEMVKVSHPLLMMAMIQAVVLGTHDGYLVQGFSEDAVAMVLDTVNGDHANLSENPRFAAEGLTTDGPVWSMSWMDLSKEGMMMGQQMGSASMMLSMAAMSNPDAGPVMQAFTQAFAKLSPAMANLNFRKSRASVGQFDIENNIFRFTSVVNYVPPAE